MSDKILKILGEKIKGYRKKMGISQEMLAEKVGVSRNTIGSIERGEQNTPILTINKIFNVFNLDLSDFIK